MLRSAAKNHESVTVMVDPADYAEVAGQIQATGETTLALRRKLAAKVFARTAAYDGAIAAHLDRAFRAAGGLEDQPASGLPGRVQAFRAAGATAALRRKPAPARRSLRPV